MNRRGFLRSLLASTATIVVAPACVLDELPPFDAAPQRTYFDMGRSGEDEIDRLIREVRPYIMNNEMMWSANTEWYRPRGVVR